MKIGELAKATGVSVRSLHHYDEIGLLKPTNRTVSEHRVYSKEDINRLQKIVTLRQVGLSLEKIGGILGEAPSVILDTVDRHIETLEVEVESKTKAIDRLKTVQSLLKSKAQLDAEKIIKSIKEVAILEKHFSNDEIFKFGQQDDSLSEQGLGDFETQMVHLIEQVRQEIKKGTKPEAPIAQDLAQKWFELGGHMVQNNSDLKNRAKEMAGANPSLGEEYGVNNEMLLFLKNALQAKKQNSTNQ